METRLRFPFFYTTNNNSQDKKVEEWGKKIASECTRENSKKEFKKERK